MITTTAEIISIDIGTNSCEVRVPLFENVGIGRQAIMPARISIQPGYYNNFKKGDLVWITFINGSMDTALIIGKIYKNPQDEAKCYGGNINLNSLRMLETNAKAELPANTTFNVKSEDYNSIDKLITKIKNLEVQNNLLLDYINDLRTRLGILDEAVGSNVVRDADGEVLSDSDNEVLHYRSEENKSY